MILNFIKTRRLVFLFTAKKHKASTLRRTLEQKDIWHPINSLPLEDLETFRFKKSKKYSNR